MLRADHQKELSLTQVLRPALIIEFTLDIASPVPLQVNTDSSLKKIQFKSSAHG